MKDILCDKETFMLYLKITGIIHSCIKGEVKKITNCHSYMKGFEANVEISEDKVLCQLKCIRYEF
jgi:hypothetical protein